ncbi:MAG TPA: hypothetical protein VFG63_02475 [Nocardioidaceae bacterium]|nr:hypothetical protein [Nocardioidaceae bacterium]
MRTARWLVRRGAALLLCLVLASACTSSGQPRLDGSTPSTAPRAWKEYSLTQPGPVMHKAVLGVQPNWYRMDELREYMQRLGGGTSWVPVVWCNIEREPDSWDWSVLDRIVDDARSLHVDLQLKLRVGACWLTERGPFWHTGFVTESQMPKDVDAYAAFVRAVVSRYSPLGVHTYSVENEPNTKYQWDGSLAQLLRLTEIAASTIRDTDPQALVADWGLSTGVYGDALADRLLAEGKDADAVEAYNNYYRTARDPVHVTSADDLRAELEDGQDQRNLLYLKEAERLLAGRVFDLRRFHFYESEDILPSVIAYLQATTPDDVPIESWELGRHVGEGVTNPRAEVVKSVCLLLAAGVREVNWLPLAAPSSGNEPNLALLGPDGAVRPAAHAYRKLARDVRGASSFRPLTVPGTSGLVMTRPGRTTLVVWSDQTSGQQLRLPPGSKVRGLAGTATLDGNTLDLGGEPVLVDIDQPLAAVRLAVR